MLQNIQNELVPSNELLETIERIEYIHTINEKDYIKGYYTEIDKDNSPALIPTKGASVRVYGLFECTVENEPLQFIYLEENVDGDVESYTHLLNTKKDLWYSYDADNKMMTIDGTKYRCTMVVDYSKKELPVVEHCIDFVMEPKTQSIYSFEGVLQGYKLSVEFAECDKAYDVMDLPFFTEEKIKFIFEGDKNSGYVQEFNTKPTEGAHVVGDIVESSNLNITYLSCEEYVSDNMFVVPSDGYQFISCEFEFENVGTSDEYVSSYDFDCYADGLNCKGTFIREDDLSATLSAGRKTKGTVTFEVPIGAEVVEVEYLSNYWTSNRVVFTVN